MKKLLLASLMLSFCAVSLKAMEVPLSEEGQTPVLKIVNNSEKDIIITYKRAQGFGDLPSTMERLGAGETVNLPQTEGNKIAYMAVRVAGTNVSQSEEIAPEKLPQLAESPTTLYVTSAGGNKLSYTIPKIEEKVSELVKLGNKPGYTLSKSEKESPELMKPQKEETIQIFSGSVELTKQRPVRIELPTSPVQSSKKPHITKIINLSTSNQVTVIASLDSTNVSLGWREGVIRHNETRTLFGLSKWPKVLDLTTESRGPIDLISSTKAGVFEIIIEKFPRTTLYRLSTDDLIRLGELLGKAIILTIDENQDISFRADQ
ncbi:hypothetical protein H0W26_06050 [Candidatus Dependentiae bacterium]|nr:hypothetical protein [Candidatus Dependentiae bacterium]